MKNQIFCFSGTGTALTIAESVSKLMGETEVISLPLSQGARRTSSAETVGFIFPIHSLGLPRAIKAAVEKIEFDNVKYIYAIATMSSEYGIAFSQLEKLLKKKGENLSSTFALPLGGNSNLFLKIGIPPMLSVEAQSEKHRLAMEKLPSIVGAVVSKRLVNESKPVAKTKAISIIANAAFSMTLSGYAKHFHTKECHRCGACVQACPNHNIRLESDGPKWKRDCDACLRCFNLCSSRAIQYGKMEDERMQERFTPYIEKVRP